MPLPQDIRPAFQNIQNTIVRADEPWIEQSPTSRMKVLWLIRFTRWVRHRQSLDPKQHAESIELSGRLGTRSK